MAKGAISSLSITGFIVSLFGFFIFFVTPISIIISIVSLVLSIVSLVVIKNKSLRGKEFAIAGIIISILVLILNPEVEIFLATVARAIKNQLNF
jgi:hypothetical protein